MIKYILLATFFISIISAPALAKPEYARYQNMQFSDGIILFNLDFSAYFFKNLKFSGANCRIKDVFCIDFDGMPFVAPCSVGTGTIGDIAFFREGRKRVRFYGRENEIFIVEAKKKNIRTRYFWSKKGLEALVLFVDNDFALYLPFDHELLKYPGKCTAQVK